jgi:hypothetical protein
MRLAISAALWIGRGKGRWVAGDALRREQMAFQGTPYRLEAPVFLAATTAFCQLGI